jgi:hypothetical protein
MPDASAIAILWYPDARWLIGAPLRCVVRAGVALCFSLAISLTVFNTASAQGADAEDWVDLFNGRDLSGWIPKIRGQRFGVNFANTFRVEDGLLKVSYQEYTDFAEQFGHIFYDRSFSHYRLRIEYRFVGDQGPNVPDWAIRNSGVMLHSQAPATMGIDQDFPISIEVQFLGGLSDGNERPTGNMCSPGTHIVYQGAFNDTHCINSTSPTFNGDQWVVSETLVLGDERIVHYINGEPVIEYGGTTTGGGVVSGHDPALKPEGRPLSEGYISLQSEGHPIHFRRVEILNLKGCMDANASNYKTYFVEDDPDSCRRVP